MKSVTHILLLLIALLALLGMLNAGYVSYLTYFVLPASDSPLICDISSSWNCSNALELEESYIFGVPSCTIAFFVYPVLIAIALLGYFGVIRWHFPVLVVMALGGMGLNGYVLYIDHLYQTYCLFCVLCGVVITLIFLESATGWMIEKKF